MHRTQISLEEYQYERLLQEARRQGVSLAALIRLLVSKYLEERRDGEKNPLEKLVGIAEGSGESVGRYHNQYLYGREKK